MTKRILLAAAAVLLALPATAQTDSHNVIVTIPTLELFSVDASDVTLAFAAPTAGGTFADVTGSSTYDVTVNSTTDASAAAGSTGFYKITAYSAAAFGTGITVESQLAAAGGGTSAGSIAIPVGSSNAADLITGISQTSSNGVAISYTAKATMAAVPGTYTQPVYYTLVQQ